MASRLTLPLISAAIGFATGIAVGAFAFGKRVGHDQTVATAPQALEMRSDIRQASERESRTAREPKDIVRPARLPATPDGDPGVVSSSRPVDGGSADESLAARVRALEKELLETQDQLKQLGGKPLTEPPELPARFKEQALLEAVRDAFREVNPKSEVTSIDCTEYPCIAYGSGLSIEQMRALNSTSAFRPYGNDDVSHLILNGTIGIMAIPKDDPNSDNDDAEQRVLFRFHQMALANKHH